MKNIFLVAKYTLIDFFKSKIFIAVFLIAIGVFAFSGLASGFAYGNPKKVSLDLGLGLMSLSLLGIALFMGVNLISKEIRDRTIYLILARGVTRTAFLFGKILGLSIALFLNALILSIFVAAIYIHNGGEINYLFILSVLFSYLSSLIILNLVLFFSLFTNVYLSVIYSIAIYVTGSVLNETSISLYVVQRPTLLKFLNLLKAILPNFSALNIRDYVIYQNDLVPGLLWSTSIYGALYAFVILGLSCYILTQKDLD